MKTCRLLFLALGVVLLAGIASSGWAAAKTNHSSCGPGQGAILPHETNPCTGSTLLLNADGSYENGYTWWYGGEVTPYYGAFAEGYNNYGSDVCGIQLALSTESGYFQDQTLDAYIWEFDGQNPGSVLAVKSGLHISPPAIWPNFSLVDIAIATPQYFCPVFVGYWGNWPGARAGWFIGADLNGYGGEPRTNIAPGIGYPTGWNDPSIVWGPTQALGIGVYELLSPAKRDTLALGACCYPDHECAITTQCGCWFEWMGPGTDCDPNPCLPPVPVERRTWGGIKARYR